MDKHKIINWSAVAREAIESKINDLELLEEITSKSKLTKKDVKEISNKIKTNAAKKFKEWKLS